MPAELLVVAGAEEPPENVFMTTTLGADALGADTAGISGTLLSIFSSGALTSVSSLLRSGVGSTSLVAGRSTAMGLTGMAAKRIRKGWG